MPPPKQIGADAGDDYSTIAGFLADVTSGSGIWSSGDDAIGEVHSDYADASEDIDFAVADQSNVSSVQVIGKSGQRHGGDPGGGGATFYAGGQKIAFTSAYTARTERIAWLEIDFESSASSVNDPVFGGGSSDYGREVDHCIVHSLTHNDWIRIGKRTDLFHNNLVFDITCSASFGAACLAIDISGDGKTTVFAAYNIVHNTGGANSSPFYRGVYGGNNASNTCKATIATDSDDTDFFNLGSSATGDNVSTDTTAPGTGSVTSATTSSLYASVAGLDFRPASASAPQVGIVASADKPSDAGASDFALDLEGNTRSSDTDAGAFEYQSAGTSVTSDLDGSHEARGIVTSDLDGSHESTSSTSSGIDSSHESRSSTSSGLEASHEARGAVTSDLDGSHESTSAVTSGLEASHEARGPEAVTSDLEASHESTSAVTSDLEASHESTSAVTSDLEASHESTSAVTSGLETSHESTSAVTSDLEAFHEARGAEAVTSDLDGSHEARGAVTSDLDGSHEAYSLVSSSLNATFEAVLSVTTSLDGSHEARGIVTSDLAAQWEAEGSDFRTELLRSVIVPSALERNVLCPDSVRRDVHIG